MPSNGCVGTAIGTNAYFFPALILTARSISSAARSKICSSACWSPSNVSARRRMRRARASRNKRSPFGVATTRIRRASFASASIPIPSALTPSRCGSWSEPLPAPRPPVAPAPWARQTPAPRGPKAAPDPLWREHPACVRGAISGWQRNAADRPPPGEMYPSNAYDTVYLATG